MKSLLLNWVSQLHFNRKVSLSSLFFGKIKMVLREKLLINTIYYTTSFYVNSMLEYFQTNLFICPNWRISMKERKLYISVQKSMSHILPKSNDSIKFKK